MGSDRDEIERMRRIRERQLHARDPLAKEKEFQRRVAGRRTETRFALSRVFEALPAKWWGMILGGLCGFVVALVLDRVLHIKVVNVDAFWANYLWYGLIFAGVVIGRGLAMSLSWSEEDYDKLVRHR